MGLDLETDQVCFDNPLRHVSYSENNKNILSELIQELLGKKVIFECEHEQGEFISPIFLREKGDGKYRMILNLKELNKHLDTTHFKMETINTVIDLITPNCYMSSIDLKDAYYSVPIKEEAQKYIKFCFQGKLYKFVCLPNGYCHGPRKFTKLLKPPLSELRTLGHTIMAYIDDLFNLGETYQDCVLNVVDTIKLFTRLGFCIHPIKSAFIPSQEITFLGFISLF